MNLSVSIFLVLCVVNQANCDAIFKFLSSKILVALGVISYSVYVWQLPIRSILVLFVKTDSVSERVLFPKIAIFVGHLSYVLLEMPIRNNILVSRSS